MRVALVFFKYRLSHCFQIIGFRTNYRKTVCVKSCLIWVGVLLIGYHPGDHEKTVASLDSSANHMLQGKMPALWIFET